MPSGWPFDRLERRVLLAALAAAAVAASGALLVAWIPWGVWARVWAGALAAALLVWVAWRLTRRAVRPVAGATTVIDALRDGDYGLRMRHLGPGVLGELAHAVNRLADLMHDASVERRESGLLLRKVLEEIDLPVFAFSQEGALVLANPAARGLIGARRPEGTKASALGIEHLLRGELPQSVRLVMPGGSGRFLVRRRGFRQRGVPHQLLVLAEVGSVLSAERNEAWQGLVRVMSHEINNSLGPIKSIAETWQRQAGDPERVLDRQRLAASLELIARRSGTLSRFVGVYSRLAKLPEPDRRGVDLAELAGKVVQLEDRLSVDCRGPALRVPLDADQVEQALINLVRNAVEAVGEADSPEVALQWSAMGDGVCIEVVDNGPGPPETDNLFVPFFTTKPGGSGIGLLLVRRIAELHGGWFELLPRGDRARGSSARLWLPGPVDPLRK